MELRFKFDFAANGRVAQEYISSHRTLDTLSHAQRAINNAFSGLTAEGGWCHSSYYGYDFRDARSFLEAGDLEDPRGWRNKNVAEINVTRKGGVDYMVISNLDPEFTGRQDYIVDRIVNCLSQAGFGYLV